MDLTFVFPCLNEERSLGPCIQAVREALDKDPALKYEIVVADNGSTDRSREIAVENGARVAPVPQRGYGAALRGGHAAAEGKYVMFADADGTYLYEKALDLYNATVKADADMGIASRLAGKIEDNAMPPLHRWLGTPILTGLINLIFKGKLTDCNSGFRCVKRESYNTWAIRSSGMEFASELLIKALKHNAKMVEIPSGLRPPPHEREPHLRTWRDGMRHLLFIFSERPRLFELGGLWLLAISTLLQVIAALTGPISFMGVHIFDVHSRLLLLLMGIAGAQFFVFGCMCYLKSSDKPLELTRKLIHMDEGSLFFLLLTLVTSMLLVTATVVVIWMLSSFAGLQLAGSLVFFTHLISVSFLVSLGLMGLHIMKRYD